MTQFQQKELHKAIMQLDPLNGSIPKEVQSIKWLAALEPQVVDLMLPLTDQQIPVIRQACKLAPGVTPMLVDVQCHFVHRHRCLADENGRGVDQLRSKVTPQDKPFEEVVEKGRLWLGILRVANGEDERRFTVKDLLAGPDASWTLRLDDSDRKLDARQRGRKRIEWALRAVSPLSSCSQLDPPIATRSNSLDQVVLTVDASSGAVGRVEARALINFVLDGQQMQPGETKITRSFPGSAEQNAGRFFANDKNETLQDQAFVEHVAEQHGLEAAAAWQPPEYHLSVDMDAFGIGMLLLALLVSEVVCPLSEETCRLIIKYWHKKYKQVSH